MTQKETLGKNYMQSLISPFNFTPKKTTSSLVIAKNLSNDSVSSGICPISGKPMRKILIGNTGIYALWSPDSRICLPIKN